MTLGKSTLDRSKMDLLMLNIEHGSALGLVQTIPHPSTYLYRFERPRYVGLSSVINLSGPHFHIK